MPINNIFRPFYVNAFFLVSGYLLFRKQLSFGIVNQDIKAYFGPNGGGKIMLENILFKLVIPTILFAAINYGPKVLLRGNAFDMKSCLMDTLGGCSLWFTCSLAIAELLFLLILSTRSKKLWLYLVVSIVCATIGVSMEKSGIRFMNSDDFPWFYKNALMAMLYMALGGLYMRYEETIDKYCNVYYMFMLLLVYLGVEFIIPDCASCLTSMEEMNILGVIVSVVGSYLLIRMCKTLHEYNLLTFIGRNSICFYFFSGALPITMSSIIGRFIEKSSIVCMLSVFVISLFIGLVITHILTKYFKFLFDLRLLKMKQHVSCMSG